MFANARYTRASISDSKLFPVIKVRGNPLQRGIAYGGLVRERIAAAWNAYRGYFSTWLERDLQATTERIFTHISSFFPDLAEELEGIAQGSGQPRWQIVALNSRTELLHEPYRVGECTAI